MEPKLKTTLTVVGAAAAAVIAKADEDRIFREAQEKLPVRDAMRELARQMDQALERELQVAIERYLRAPLTDPEQQVRGRLAHCCVEGDDGLTYVMDGTPILWVAPAAVERDGNQLRAERPIKQLLPEVPE